MSTNPVPLRLITALHALGILAQAVLAGQFLAGADSSVVLHEKTGLALVILGLFQIIFAITAKAPLWFVISTAGIFLGEGLQVGTGYGRFLNVHIPLSILIVAGVTAQLLWTFRQRQRA